MSDADEVIRLYRTGMTMREVAAHIGRSETYVRYRLPLAERRRSRPKYGADVRDKALTMVAEGTSVAEAAARCGIPERTLYYWVRDVRRGRKI